MKRAIVLSLLVILGCHATHRSYRGPDDYAGDWRKYKDFHSMKTLEALVIREGMSKEEVLKFLGKPDKVFQPGTGTGGPASEDADLEIEYWIDGKKEQHPWSYSIHFKKGKVVDYGEWTRIAGPVRVVAPKETIRAMRKRDSEESKGEEKKAPNQRINPDQ